MVSGGELDGSLDRIAGTYRPVGWERVGQASDSFWRNLAGAFFAQFAIVLIVSWVAPREVWDAFMRTPFVPVTAVAALLLAIVGAYAGATEIYVIDGRGIRVDRGWPLPSWSASRAEVLDARLTKGMFRWTLLISLANGVEKRLVLSETMRSSRRLRW